MIWCRRVSCTCVRAQFKDSSCFDVLNGGGQKESSCDWFWLVIEFLFYMLVSGPIQYIAAVIPIPTQGLLFWFLVCLCCQNTVATERERERHEFMKHQRVADVIETKLKIRPFISSFPCVLDIQHQVLRYH